MPAFKIRPATVTAADADTFLNFYDSHLDWLRSIGSGEQWGTESIWKNADAVEDVRDQFARSEKNLQWDPDWCRAYIAEAEVHVGHDEKPKAISVAGIVLSAKASETAQQVLPEQDDSYPFVYLSGLLANREAGVLCKGSGAALIAHAKDVVRQLGLRRLCVDCWDGNGRGLVR